MKLERWIARQQFDGETDGPTVRRQHSNGFVVAVETMDAATLISAYHNAVADTAEAEFTRLEKLVKGMAGERDAAATTLTAAQAEVKHLTTCRKALESEVTRQENELDALKASPGTVQLGEPVAFKDLKPGTQFQHTTHDHCTYVKLRSPQGLWTALIVAGNDNMSGTTAQVGHFDKVRPLTFTFTAPAVAAVEPGEWVVKNRFDNPHQADLFKGNARIVASLPSIECRYIADRVNCDTRALRQRVAELEQFKTDADECVEVLKSKVADLIAQLDAARATGQAVEQWIVDSSPGGWWEVCNSNGMCLITVNSKGIGDFLANAHNASRAALTELQAALIELGKAAIQVADNLIGPAEWGRAINAVRALQSAEPPKAPEPRYEVRGEDPFCEHDEDTEWGVWDNRVREWEIEAKHDKPTARELAKVLNKETP